MLRSLEGAKTALAKTPDMLPVLKEVGVVDSGGQGLVFIYEGFLFSPYWVNISHLRTL